MRCAGDGAASTLEKAISMRAERAHPPVAASALLTAAMDRLQVASVAAVAGDLGVSERHLRRVLRAAIGVSPKT